MSVVVYETPDSMSGTLTHDFESGETREVRRSYVIGQCEGFGDVIEKLEPYAPRYVEAGFTYWRRQRVDVSPIGNKYFQAAVTYSTLVPSSDGGGGGGVPSVEAGAIAWDTTGHTEHITQSLEQSGFPQAGAPDFEGAINVSGNTVGGLDVVRPCLRYSETWIMPAAIAISASFVGAVYQRTGTVNLQQFRAFAPGEALFLGARASWQGDSPFVAVTFDFEARPNGKWYSQGFGEEFDKEGWQYVWCLYETAESNDRLVQRPIYAYRETVYEKKEWSGLLIVGRTPASPRQGGPVQPPNAPGNGFN